jgi:hypothetical protein
LITGVLINFYLFLKFKFWRTRWRLREKITRSKQVIWWWKSTIRVKGKTAKTKKK